MSLGPLDRLPLPLEQAGMHAGVGRFERRPFLVAFGGVRSEADQQNEFDHQLLLDAARGLTGKDEDHNKLLTRGMFASAALSDVIFQCLTNVRNDLAYPLPLTGTGRSDQQYGQCLCCMCEVTILKIY